MDLSTLDQKEAIDYAISVVGGPSALGRALAVRPQSVNCWRVAAAHAAAGKRWTGRPVQISVERAVELEKLLRAPGLAERLRPDKAEHFAYLRGSRRG